MPAPKKTRAASSLFLALMPDLLSHLAAQAATAVLKPVLLLIGNLASRSISRTNDSGSLASRATATKSDNRFASDKSTSSSVNSFTSAGVHGTSTSATATTGRALSPLPDGATKSAGTAATRSRPAAGNGGGSATLASDARVEA